MSIIRFYNPAFAGYTCKRHQLVFQSHSSSTKQSLPCNTPVEHMKSQVVEDIPRSCIHLFAFDCHISNASVLHNTPRVFQKEDSQFLASNRLMANSTLVGHLAESDIFCLTRMCRKRSCFAQKEATSLRASLLMFHRLMDFVTTCCCYEHVYHLTAVNALLK